MSHITLETDRGSRWNSRNSRSCDKYVYSFGGGKAEGNGKMKDVLGGKGAGLAEMTNAGLARTSGIHHPDGSLPRVHENRQDF